MPRKGANPPPDQPYPARRCTTCGAERPRALSGACVLCGAEPGHYSARGTGETSDLSRMLGPSPAPSGWRSHDYRRMRERLAWLGSKEATLGGHQS